MEFLVIKSDEYKKWGCPKCGLLTSIASDPDSTLVGFDGDIVQCTCGQKYGVTPNLNKIPLVIQDGIDGKSSRVEQVIIDHPRKGEGPKICHPDSFDCIGQYPAYTLE